MARVDNRVTVKRPCGTSGSGDPVRRLAAALLVLLAMAGCDASSGPEDRSTEVLSTSGVTAPVTSIVVPSPGEDALVFTVSVPSGGPGCASRPEAHVTDFDRETMEMKTVVESNHATYCTGTTSRTFTAKVALRGRTLVVNGESWTPGTGGFVRCRSEVGCAPPDDRCDPVWTRTLTPHFDLPPEKRAAVVACSGQWLVMDVEAVFTGCQSVNGSTPSAGCADGGVHRRWFARLDERRNWQVVASGTSAGCADVRRSVPSFPRALCTGLGAP